jgi:fumarylacetoacetate (FAA) hydrolase
MRLCTFAPHDGEGRPGRVEGARVVQLGAGSLTAFLAGGCNASDEAEFPLDEIRLLAPIPDPPSVRDFFAFEQHVATARARRGGEVPPEWYAMPAFYFSNPAAIVGPDDAVPYPDATQELDYELEAAAVIGAGGRIAGFTVLNDWSARDLQREETRIGLGPAKGKDFATSLGPVLVTVDEFDGSAGTMTARVNGEERSRGELADIYHSWDAILARAALNTTLRPGDVIGSGTVGGGCILEHGDDRWLRPGDVVELEIEGIGVLRNTIGPPGSLTGGSRTP